MPLGISAPIDLLTLLGWYDICFALYGVVAVFIILLYTL